MGRCWRRRRWAFTSRSLARIRSRIVCRTSKNFPSRDFALMCGKPRKSKVAGFPRFRSSLLRNEYMVTKAFTEIDFKHQVRPGDSVDFWGKVNRWGNTSLTIELKVLAWRPESNERREVLDVKGVFVAIDPQGRKQKIIPADEDQTGVQNAGPST